MPLSIGIRLSVKCKTCGQDCDNHDPYCPVPRLQAIFVDVQYGDCPICKRGRTEVNADDYFECRHCHTLFTSADCPPSGEGSQKTLLHFPGGSGQMIPVVILKEKGAGKFPYDTEIARLQEEEVRVREAWHEARIKMARKQRQEAARQDRLRKRQPRRK
jgi:hypothetical protein